MILNLDPHYKPGSHWVAIIKNDKNLIYFDSYGRPPTKDVELKMKKAKQKEEKAKQKEEKEKKEIIPMYNDKQLQPYQSFKYNSFLCGYYCIYVIREIESGKSFQEILDKLEQNNPLTNDKYMKEYFTEVIKNKK
jgi:hypothetical protein